ncbi:ATP-binding cassette domain-containing protein [Teichococcus oryzae]|nr:ATP-binding cassette domain-containing protein [Pseudoroseomonas oryzae]
MADVAYVQTTMSGSSRQWLLHPFTCVMTSYGTVFAPSVIAATLLVTLLALALPTALLQVYDRILPNGATGTLAALACAVVVAIILEALLRHVRSRILARIAAAAEAQAHRAAMQSLLNAPVEALEAHGNGYYAERLAAIGTLREAWSGPALQAMLDLPFALLYLLGIWYLAGPLVLVPLALLAAVGLLAFVTGAWVRRAAQKLALAEERRFNFLFDTLHGIQAMKLLGAEPLLERRYERLQAGSAQGRRMLGQIMATGQEGGLLLTEAATVAVPALGCIMVLEGRLTVGGLGACTMLAGRAMQPLLGGIAVWARLQSLAESRQRVAEIGALPDERPRARPALDVSHGHVLLSNVGLRLNGQQDWLFNGLSLECRPGELIGITGANGSGRSTLLRIMAGEVAPDAGQVRIDGQDLATIDAAGARRRVALVPADPALIRGTFLQNLTLHQPHLEAAALRLAGELGLDQVAGGLPGGWHTSVGMAGMPLPRGVAQRIGVVRALVEGPRILLLDDISAQIDAEGDLRLARLLTGLRGNVSVIIVTHRRSTLNIADRVLAIRDGRLEPQGRGQP